MATLPGYYTHTPELVAADLGGRSGYTLPAGGHAPAEAVAAARGSEREGPSVPPAGSALTTIATWFLLTAPSVTGFAFLTAKWSLLTAVSIYAGLFILAAVVDVVPAGWGRAVGGGPR